MKPCETRARFVPPINIFVLANRSLEISYSEEFAEDPIEITPTVGIS